MQEWAKAEVKSSQKSLIIKVPLKNVAQSLKVEPEHIERNTVLGIGISQKSDFSDLILKYSMEIVLIGD